MPGHSYRATLSRPGLQPFLWTQFLGAFNDNLFKIVVSLLAVRAAAGASGRELSLVGAVFILPFLLFSGYAGQLADIYSKRRVLIVTKSLEIVTAALGLFAFAANRLELTYVVLFLFAVQATFFSPAKYGILPEFLPDADLSRANGVLEMSTFVAIVVGTAAGSFLLERWSDHLWWIGAAVLALAAIGTLASFGIPEVKASTPAARLRWNPWGEVVDGVTRLRSNRVLWLTVIGISYFWFLGSLLQLVTVLFGAEVLHLNDSWTGLLTAFAAIGIGVGSLAAGRLSGDKVELGLAPLGALGMGVFAILLSRATTFPTATVHLTLVGFCGGLFAVPLNALLQQKSGDTEKGRLMATNNFINMLGVMAASVALYVMTTLLHLRPETIVLTFGVLTLVSSLYVLWLVPEFLIRFSLWLLTHTVYRIRIEGHEQVPSRGPALLVCNHISLVDGFLVGACVQRFVRFLIYRPYYDHPALHWLMKLMHAIPAAAGTRRDAVASIEQAREELKNGHIVCIFAEGAISRTGNLLPFKRGFEHIIEGLDVPVVPVYLDRVWGSIFSFKGGRFFGKRPAAIPYPVTVAFGRPLAAATTTAASARLAIQELGSQTAAHRRPAREVLAQQFVRTAKRRWWALSMADSTGRRLTFGRALTGSLLLARIIRRRTGGQKNIGLLLPGSVGGALANISVSMAGKVPVNLNFTAGSEAVAYAIKQCDISTIVSSRVFLAKAGLEAMPGMVFLEDILPTIGKVESALWFVAAYVLPWRLLCRLFLDSTTIADDTATIIFSSGSTGIPKGVVLTHRNLLSNIDAISQVFEIDNTDVMIGVLPFFHSFGFTGTLWLPLVGGFSVAYHPNPTDARTVGELAATYRATLLISTPTFCSTYIRKCTREQFAHLRIAMVGAEKLRESVAHAFRDKFGIDLLEGYGCTEMAPVVSANVPNVDDGVEHQVGVKFGSVGHPLPGVAAKVVDVETGEGPLLDKEGLLLVKGPNLMAGYLHEPERTREVMRDGWYVTGDIARIDDEGFIYITDRLSRFSKIGGEMVPHMKVEETLCDLLHEPHSAIVTAIADEAKGERLVAFYTDDQATPQSLWEQLSASELPKLWIPKREDIRFLESIPTLGTGKVDLRAVRRLAQAAPVAEGVQ